MKKNKYLFIILLILLFLVTGCSNGLLSASQKKYATVGFSITDFDSTKFLRSITVPDDYEQSDYKFQIEGILQNEFYNDINKRTSVGTAENEYITLDELKSLSYKIETGEWQFTVNAFVQYKENLVKISQAVINENITETKNELIFTLEPLSDSTLYGDFNIKVIFNPGNISSINISLFKTIDDLVSNKSVIKNVDLYAEQYTSGEIVIGDILDPGYYYLKYSFYSDEDMKNIITSRIIVVKIISCYTSIGTYEYDDFNKHNVYKISYKDAGGRDFTGVLTDDLPVDEIRVEEGESGNFNLPDASSIKSSLSSDLNPIVFEGWFNDINCTDKVTSSINNETILKDTVYYAKWSYKNVYVDPASTTANDTNSGNSTQAPFKTVGGAKLYMGTNSEVMYVMSSISGSLEAMKLSDLTTSAYNNAIVKREDSCVDMPIVSLGQDNIVIIKNTTFDGGAIFPSGNIADDVNSGTVEGLKSTYPIFHLSKNAYLTLNENCIIRNNYNSSASVENKRGGGIHLQENAVLMINSSTSEICFNYGGVGGGIYMQGSNSSDNPIVSITEGVIRNNCSKNMGGGICVMNRGDLSISNENTDGSTSNIQIINNDAKDGGGIYLEGSSSSDKIIFLANNAEITGNNAYKITVSDSRPFGNGGGIFVGNNVTATFTNVKITKNVCNGAGAGLLLNQEAYLIDCNISENQSLGGSTEEYNKGAGVYLANENLYLTGSTVIENNLFQNLQGESVEGKGRGVYLSATAKLIIAGKSYIDLSNDIYINKSSTNYPIEISTDYSLPSGIDKIACITPNVYPSTGDYINAVNLSKIEDNADKEIFASYFDVSSDPTDPDYEYFVNTSGQIVSNNLIGSGNVEIPTVQNISFSIEESEYYNDTQFDVPLISLLIEDSVVTDIINDVKWDEIKVLSGGVDVTSLANCSVNQNIVTFPQNIAPGSYQIYVCVTYKNLFYSASITIQINKKEQSGGNSDGNDSIDIEKIETEVTEDCSMLDLASDSDIYNCLELYYQQGVTSITLELPNATDSTITNVLSQLSRRNEIKVALDLSKSSVTILPSSGLTYTSQVIAIYLPETITEIQDRAFSGCSGLTKIHIPESVVTIGDGAFSYCENLIDVHLPSKLEVLPMQLFSGCKNLKSVNIPYNANYINRQVFGECYNLSFVEFDNPDGWFAGTDVGAEDENSLDVSDPVTNASRFLDSGFTYIIYKK